MLWGFRRPGAFLARTQPTTDAIPIPIRCQLAGTGDNVWRRFLTETTKSPLKPGRFMISPRTGPKSNERKRRDDRRRLRNSRHGWPNSLEGG
jgi:hypothetical protein